MANELGAAIAKIIKALSDDPLKLRGRSQHDDPSRMAAHDAAIVLPGAAHSEILDSSATGGVYSADFPNDTLESLRDKVVAATGQKLAWDEKGKQWYRGVGEDITLSVQMTATAVGDGEVATFILIRA